jgi:hypothetical protein
MRFEMSGGPAGCRLTTMPAESAAPAIDATLLTREGGQDAEADAPAFCPVQFPAGTFGSHLK